MNGVTQHLRRMTTGLALLMILTAARYFGGLVLAGILLVVALLGIHEFFSLFGEAGAGRTERILGLVLTAGMIILAWARPEAGVLPGAAAFVILALFFLARWAADESYAFSSVALVAAGLAYVPLLLIPALSFSLHEQILIVCVPIFTDSAAYFCGVRFGRHKIWPKVSPKKSVEGSLGGLAASVAVCVTLGLWLGQAGAAAFVGLGLALGIMAQLGDFFESALKRAHHVKDSGNILPGHGGVLDRIDSLLFVIPAYLLCRAFCNFF